MAVDANDLVGRGAACACEHRLDYTNILENILTLILHPFIRSLLDCIFCQIRPIFCQAQPKAKPSWAEIALISSKTPTYLSTHQPTWKRRKAKRFHDFSDLNCYCSFSNKGSWSVLSNSCNLRSSNIVHELFHDLFITWSLMVYCLLITCLQFGANLIMSS